MTNHEKLLQEFDEKFPNAVFAWDDHKEIKQFLLKALKEQREELIKDMAYDDTEIRNLASKVLTEYEVSGDSYGVPSILDIIETLIKQREALMLDEKQLNWIINRHIDFENGRCIMTKSPAKAIIKAQKDKLDGKGKRDG